MQEPLRLQKGRGRGLNRGGGSVTKCQPRVPAIPPFPFQNLKAFGIGDAQVTAQKPLTMGRGMSNIETLGPYDPMLPGQCFSVPWSSRGLCEAAPANLNGPEARTLSGPARSSSGPSPHGPCGPYPQGLSGSAPRGLGGPAPRGLSGPAPRGFSGPSPHSSCGTSPQGFSSPAPRFGFSGPSRHGSFGTCPQGVSSPAPRFDFSGPAPRGGFSGPAPRGGFGGPSAKGLGGPVPRVLRKPSPLGLSDPAPLGRGFCILDNGPRFLEPERGEIKPSQSHFIPSLPEPRPNSLTQLEWDVFNRNGRPLYKNVCAVFCCCTFGEDNGVVRTFSFCCDAKSRLEHAEKKAIEQLLMLENGTGRELRQVLFISSRSPCIPCAKDMITFVKSRGFSMNLYFTALQKEINPEKCGIGLLRDFGIPMRIADKHIWSYLTSLLAVCDGLPRTTLSDGSKVNVIIRKAWDVVWSHQLGAVLYRDHQNVLDSQSLLAKFHDVRRMMMAEAQTNS